MVALPGLWPTAASPTLPLSPLGRDPGSGTRRLQLGSLVYGRQSLPELTKHKTKITKFIEGLGINVRDVVVAQLSYPYRSCSSATTSKWLPCLVLPHSTS